MTVGVSLGGFDDVGVGVAALVVGVVRVAVDADGVVGDEAAGVDGADEEHAVDKVLRVNAVGGEASTEEGVDAELEADAELRLNVERHKVDGVEVGVELVVHDELCADVVE